MLQPLALSVCFALHTFAQAVSTALPYNQQHHAISRVILFCPSMKCADGQYLIYIYNVLYVGASMSSMVKHHGERQHIPMAINKGEEKPIKVSSRARLGVLPRLIGVQIILLCSLPPFQPSLNLSPLLPLSWLCVGGPAARLPASTVPKQTLFTVCQ